MRAPHPIRRRPRIGWIALGVLCVPATVTGEVVAEEEAEVAVEDAEGTAEGPVLLPPGEVMRRALDRSPVLWGSEQRVEMLRAVPDQLSALPLTTVNVMAMGFPGGPDGGWEIRYGARQTLPLGDRLDERAEVAWAAADAARAGVDSARLEIVFRLRLAYVDLGRALAEVEVIDDQYATMRRMSRIATGAYAAGMGSGTQADALRARAELPMLEDQRRMAEAAAEADRARIAALAALAFPEAPADPTPIDVDAYEPVPPPSLDELLAGARERRPEYSAFEAEARRAEAAVRAAAEERVPDLMIEGAIQQGTGGMMAPVAFQFGVGITLPWLQPDRYDGMEAEARAMGRIVRAEENALDLDLEAELRALLAQHDRLAAGVGFHRRAIRTLRQAQSAALSAYTAGTASFDAVLAIEARMLDTRRALIRTVYEIHALLARIDRVVARPPEEQILFAEVWQ